MSPAPKNVVRSGRGDLHLGGPVRMCVGCRERHPQGELLRFRRRPDGEVVPVTGRRTSASGRGGRSAYLCPTRACHDRAQKRRAFGRAFGRAPAGGQGLSVRLEGLKLWPAMATHIAAGLDQHAQLIQRTRAGSHGNTLHAIDRLRAQLRSELGVRGKDA